MGKIKNNESKDALGITAWLNSITNKEERAKENRKFNKMLQNIRTEKALEEAKRILADLGGDVKLFREAHPLLTGAKKTTAYQREYGIGKDLTRAQARKLENVVQKKKQKTIVGGFSSGEKRILTSLRNESAKKNDFTEYFKALSKKVLNPLERDEITRDYITHRKKFTKEEMEIEKRINEKYLKHRVAEIRRHGQKVDRGQIAAMRKEPDYRRPGFNAVMQMKKRGLTEKEAFRFIVDQRDNTIDTFMLHTT